MTTLDHALDTVMKLPHEQRETLISILLRRQAEERRGEIAENAREAISAFHSGALRTETAKDLIRRFHAAVGDEE